MDTLATVKEYYGKVLKSKNDLQSNACCSADAFPDYVKDVVKQIHPEVLDKFYGCGLNIPFDLQNRTVLDLGSGSGRDAYLLSRLVGPGGRVIGIDMTEAQLEVADRHRTFHAQAFGYSESNVEFRKGYIEDLESAQIESQSIDVIVSNCVINLSPDKRRVLREAFRVLKPGGELFFSDIFADRRLPAELAQDPVLLGECLGGALYLEDFRRQLLELGCRDFRIVAQSPVTVGSPALREKLGMARFSSVTVRAFKIDLEDKCEDYGQVATYLGTIPESPHSFLLDDHHLLERKRPMLVCGNTAAMLGETRYARHFQIKGDKSTHFGLFPCGPAVNKAVSGNPVGGACC